MKRFDFWKRSVAVAVLLVTLLLAVACKGGAVELSYQEGAYRSQDGEQSYSQAPFCYKAVSILTDEQVAYVTENFGKILKEYL